jgi:hypothetical protein
LLRRPRESIWRTGRSLNKYLGYHLNFFF